MYPVKLDPKVVLASHAFLLDRLAFAIEWVRLARKKITVHLPDPVPGPFHNLGRSGSGCVPVHHRPRSQYGCPPPTHWVESRVDAELLLAVLHAMEETPRKSPKVKAAIKRRT